MSKQAAEDLKAARSLITDPSKWTVGWFARDAAGNKTSACGPEAVCFCTAGALIRVVNDDHGRYFAAREYIYAYTAEKYGYEMHGGDISAINDGLGHAAALDMLDKAIALAEASS